MRGTRQDKREHGHQGRKNNRDNPQTARAHGSQTTVASGKRDDTKFGNDADKRQGKKRRVI